MSRHGGKKCDFRWVHDMRRRMGVKRLKPIGMIHRREVDAKQLTLNEYANLPLVD